MMKTKTIKKIFALILTLSLSLGFFVWPNFLKSIRANNQGEVVINEIMWMGSSSSPSDEWLKLHNLTNQDIDFFKTNWKIYKNDSLMITINQGILYANDYFLIAQKSKDQSILNINPDLIASSSFSLNNNNVQYELYDEQNNLIDIADDGQGVPLAGSNSSPKATMERNPNPGDGTLKENWYTATTSINFDSDSTELGTPRAENSQENQAPEIILASVSPTSVVADGQSAVKFQIQIRDPDGKQDINQVIIDLSKIGGQEEKMNSLDNELYDYQFITPISIEAGKYEIPIIVSDNSENITEGVISLNITSPTYSDKIIINELYPNPIGSDNEGEFIELKNTGSEPVDLKDWQIKDNSNSSPYKIESASISGNRFFVVYPKGKITLTNTGDTISLLSPDGITQDLIRYSETAPEGQSFSLISSGWSWTQTTTPGQENVLSLPASPNKNPKAIAGDNKKLYVNEEATFDGSESYDPDNDPLNYFWDFGDGASVYSATTTHKYVKEGKYSAKLKVEDGRGGIAEDTLSVTVSKKKEEKTTKKKTTKKITKKKITTKKKEVIKPKGPFSRDIIISEFLPNPSGNDYGNGSLKSGEWIEIKNKGKKEIDLSFWQLDDESNGSKPYTIEDKKIKAGQFLVFYYPETKINLSNENDKVRLIDPDGKIVNQVEYSKAKENLSFALDKNNKWYWTEKLTPGAENQIIEPEKKEEKTENKIDDQNTEKIDKKLSQTKNIILKSVSIQEAKELSKNSNVKIEGQVLVEPGILGSKIFYIQDENSGIQIYSYYQDFPNLSLGDKISIIGKISESQGEKKINISQKEDIGLLSHGDEPEALTLKTGEINEKHEGKLIETTAEIVKKTGSSFYLDDGTGQARVYIPETANIKKEGIKKGEKIKIKGIVSQTKSGFRILPRYENDILIGEEIAAAAQNNSKNLNKDLPSVGNNVWVLALLALIATSIIKFPKLATKSFK